MTLLIFVQKLVAAADEGEAYTTFTGATRLRQGVTPKGVFIPEEEVKSDVQLSRSVTVPAPSTSLKLDHPLWNVSQD